MVLRNITENDLDSIVRIHLQSFEGFFLTSLGPNFINSYYKAAITDSSTLSVCILVDNNIIGFATGTTLPKGYHKRIFLSNPLAFSFSLFRKIIIPSVFFRLIKNANKKSQDTSIKQVELLSLAVSKEFKGRNYGVRILEEFEKLAISKGCLRITLTTDVNENDSVIKFYNKNGYQKIFKFITYPNREMYRMSKDFQL